MDEALIKKVQPHSMEAEQSTIGSMLMDREAIAVASEMLRADDFYEKQLGIFFEVLVQLYQDGVDADLVTMQDRLRGRQVPEEFCSLEYLSHLIDVVPTSVNIKNYAQIVREKSLLRQFIRVTEGLVNSCYLDKENVEELFGRAEGELFSLLQVKKTGEIDAISSIVVKALENIEAAAKNKGAVTGIATGFYDLDYKTAGLQPSDLVLIAARPSMGKTAFVLNLAEHIAIKNQVPTAIFSLEMSKVQLVNRLLSMHSHVDAQSIRTGSLDDGQWQELVGSARTIGESALILDDTPGITVAELRSKCRKLKLEKNLGLVIIDYLQLMSGGGRSESRQQEISEISRSLKALARELACPVVALSQLSRAVEGRPDKRPMLSDLRESGAIEQDADVVMFLYRDEYYNPDTDQKGVAEIIIGKQRNGPTGTVKLGWIGEMQKFVNLQREDY